MPRSLRQSAPPGSRPPARRQAPRRRKWLRALAWTIGGIGVLTASAIGALVLFAPVGLIRDQVVREVKAKTGRDLKITGRTSLSFYPSLGVSMGDVTLSAPPAMGGGPFVQMRQLEASVSVMPLLSRRVVIDRVVLTDPVFELRVDQNGRRSWDFAEYMPAAVVMVAQAGGRSAPGTANDGRAVPPELEEFLRNSSGTPPLTSPAGEPPAAASGGRGGLQDISLGDVRIDNGTLRYKDERGGISEEVRAIHARLSGKSLASPVEAKGSLALRGDRIDFDGRLSTPRALMEERPVRVALAITSPRASGRYNGTLGLAKGPQLDGNLKLDVPSVRSLVQWIGVLPSAAPGLGLLALETELKSGPAWVALTNAKLRLDEISGTGNANFDFVGGRPNLKANLKLGAVDLNPYLRHQGDGPGAELGPDLELRGPAAKGPGLKAASPQVKGFTQRSGWSEEPLNVLFLGALDADVRLSLASLAYQEIKVGAVQFAFALKNRALRTTIEDVKLYGGQGRGTITLDATAAGASVGVNLAIEGVNALPLLKDAADFNWIDGRGKFQIAVAGQGSSQRAIMTALNGKAEFAFSDGAIVGYNIPQMIRGISQGRLSGFNRVPTEKTDFSEAGASFQIRNGIAETKDLRALSPLVRLTGTGTANLGQRQIDATLRPKLVGALSGQGGAGQGGAGLGGAGELAGLELPVRIRGPWERPQIGPDVDGLLKNPGQAVDALKELGRQIQQGKGGNLNQLIDQFRRK